MLGARWGMGILRTYEMLWNFRTSVADPNPKPCVGKSPHVLEYPTCNRLHSAQCRDTKKQRANSEEATAALHLSAWLRVSHPDTLNSEPLSLRVQVPKNHMLNQNLYYDYYYPKPKYLIIGYLGP